MLEPRIHEMFPGVLPAAPPGARHPHHMQAPAPGTGALSVVAGVTVAVWLWVAAPWFSRPEPGAPSAARAAPGPPRHGPHSSDAPRVTAAPATAAGNPDRDIARLGAQPPRYADSMRERYLKSGDLYRLLYELLPDAAAGERASQYYVYLTLGQCQTYLRMDAESARALNEDVLFSLNDRPAEERLLWQAEYRRCQGFAGGDLSPLREAMGEDTPGAEIEYASIWFQRAAAAGFPPALSEAALRINLLSPAERISLLEESVLSADPDVYWQLFLNGPGEGAGETTPAGMAWLILACRAGHDCTRGAEWFRSVACLQDDTACTPDESAIEHYWYTLAEPDRQAAHSLAGRMARDLAAGRLDRLPWPTLANRNIYENRLARD